jgi:rod shape-determining protein MreC
MESFFTRYKNALVLMIVLLAQVVLLAMQVRRPAPNMPDGHNVRLWRFWVASVVTPPEKLAHEVGSGLRGIWSKYIYLRHLREENDNLRDENTRLRLEQAGLAEDAVEGQRLREMLEFRAQYIDKTLPAQVVGTSGTDQAHVIYIDKGTKDGIRPQMPVITPDGVVGKVKNVFPGTAQVLLISDQTSGAGVMLQTTRIRGVMKGNASGEPQIINISPDDRIKPGELVLTSGGDEVYPRGLPVGVVDRVVPDPETSYVNVVVKPNANLSRLEEVMVITGISDKMPFALEKDMMQSEVDALAEKQRASDILSEKLPSIRDEDSPESKLAAQGDSESASTASAGGSEGGPARPMRPPQPLHPDRYTPGAAPTAENLTPGAAPPGLHRDLSQDASAATPPRPAKSSTTSDSGATSANSAPTSSESAPVSRFPAKPHPATSTTAETNSAAPATSTSTASGTSTPKPAAGTPATTAGNGTVASHPLTRPATTSSSGIPLPLQPAYPTASRTQPAVGAGSSATTSGSSVGSTAAAAIPKPVTKPTIGVSPSTTAVASGATTSTGVARTASSTPTASHRISIPATTAADGILTPAGMGLIGTPRPKPAAPATTPATAPSAGTQSAPARQPAQTPPGGR